MRNIDETTITQAVLERFADTPDPRHRRIFESLVRHLHGFAREVRLTEAEWGQAIDFLTRTGQVCDARRQEFILLSDVLGLSMLTVAMHHDGGEGCTESTVFGPFHVAGAPEIDQGEDIARGAPGMPCEVAATVRGEDGAPVAGALVDVWQADAEGLYDVQRPELDHAQNRARLRTDSAGALRFRAVVPQAYPIPTDGPVGELLRAAGRHPWRPAHLHFMIAAPGYETLVTHVFRADDAYLDSDAVFGVRQSLLAQWEPAPQGGYRMHHDFVLQRSRTAAAVP
ncbi:intradiol ring-cleavage dioxygenase [Pseudorhodoferax sp.]|uniref:intradiol ring-cleavage dioxygenase n=1 Tax=Pseudorhodoferax sp. TaxID=1993553 RepID=UPI002DD67D79|nr:intradiol ring-cleavage dioxygenase [Pseudorhodoferax sp.]